MSDTAIQPHPLPTARPQMQAPVTGAAPPSAAVPAAARPSRRRRLRLIPRRMGGGLLVQTWRSVSALMLREISTTYGNSAGGYLWALLDPILGIGLLTLVFSQFFAVPALGTNFPLFYATGYLPFMMFNDVANKMAISLRYSGPFLSYPAVTFFDVLFARLLLNAGVHLVVFAIVLMSIVLIYDMPLVLDVARLAEGLALTVLLAAGIGVMNCFLMTRFPLWERTWQIITRPLFMISGIFFLWETMPAGSRDVLWYNPIVHVIAMVRQGVYLTYNATFVDPLFVTALSLLLLVSGLALLMRHYRDLMER